MTSRGARLLRLVQLRERQHDVAALHLRAARGALAAAESALRDAQDRSRTATLCRLASAVDNDSTEWLLACADVEVSALSVAVTDAERARVRSVVQKAAEAEGTARRERKQMEATFEVVQRECAEQAARAEQHVLDEIARLQRAGEALTSWRRRF